MYGRRHDHALPLSSVVHQIYTLAQAAGWDLGDDCVALNAYLVGRGDVHSLRQPVKDHRGKSVIDERTIADLMVGIHSAAAIEALRFAQLLGLDLPTVAEFVKDAAGFSVMFSKIFAQLENDADVTLKSTDGFDLTRHDLVRFLSPSCTFESSIFFQECLHINKGRGC